MTNIKATVGPAKITSVIEADEGDIKYELISLDHSPRPPRLHVYKLWQDAHLPEYGSEWAACFDLKAGLRDGDNIRLFTSTNGEKWRKVVNKKVVLNHRERMLVPTGLVFDLREGEVLRIHPRSGLALKTGIIISNCEGIVDADYVQQTYVMLTNVSKEPFEIMDGMRIAQAEVATFQQYVIEQTDVEPEDKTSRTGGFGSTGV